MSKKILSVLVCLALSPWVFGQGETVVDGVAAVVGRNIVRYSDIERSYAQMKLRGTPEISRCEILENLLLNQLLLHKGEVDSVEVTDDEVKQYVDQYLQNDMLQYGSKEGIREATGFEYDELKEQYTRMIHDAFLSQRVQYQITSDVAITPAEVSEFYASFPADSLPQIPERYELSEIVIEPQISEAERDRVRTQLAELRERVVKGESFSMLATLYSQDPGSARKGGELGFFPRGYMVSEFESAAFALKPGEVSPIVETQFGFHIIQLIERRGNTINCRHILIAPKVSSEQALAARRTLDSLASQIRLGTITFDEAARRYSSAPSAKQGGAVTNPDDNTSRFTRAETDRYYFKEQVHTLDPGQVTNANAFSSDEGRDCYRIVRLDRKYPAHPANLADDYDAIYNAALAAKKQARLNEWAIRQARNTYIRLNGDYQQCHFSNLTF